MTLDQLQQRDARIDALEALGTRGRTRDQEDELGKLRAGRDAFWRRFPRALQLHRLKIHELEAYARQHRFTFEPAPSPSLDIAR